MPGPGDQYSIAIEATLESQQAQQGLEQLSDTITDVRQSGSGSLDRLGKSADDAGDSFDDLGASAGRAGRGLGAGGLAGVAVIAVSALIELGKYIKKAHDEHERLQRLSERLDLPYAKVKRYSEAWLDIARSLDDVARGFEGLTEAQSRAFDALGLDKGGGAAAGNSGLSRIAVAEGTTAQKIDALQILFPGMTYEKAEKELTEEIDRLARKVWLNGPGGRLVAGTQAQREGLEFGRENLSTLFATGQILAPEFLAQEKALGDALADFIKTGEKVRKEAEEKREKDRKDELQRFVDGLEVQVDAQKVAVDRIFELYESWDEATKTEVERQIDYLDEFRSKLDEIGSLPPDHPLYKTPEVIRERWQEALDDTLEVITVTHRKLGDGLTEIQRAVRDNVTEPIKEGLRNMAIQGEFSIKSLIRNVIAALLNKQLFDAIDKLGDALTNALGGSGGGFGDFLGGLLGVKPGTAGGGYRDSAGPLAEDGPELLVPTSGGIRVLNQRQLAFAAGQAGGGSGGGGGITLHYTPQYSLSGVDTTQMIAYIERSREQDQQGILKMLYDNGLGRMR